MRISAVFFGAWIAILAVVNTSFSKDISGYDSYINWKDWPKLKTDTSAGLASSYDRTGGNNDFNQYEYPSGFRSTAEIVTAKTLEGPGIIYRFWMPHWTANSNFLINMYFDGEITPRISSNSLALLSGAYGYFHGPLVDTCAGGQVCYEPIPFKQSLRIETENKPPYRHYYQYSYIKLANDANITSFTGSLTAQQQNSRNSVTSLLNKSGEHPAGTSLNAIDINYLHTAIAASSGITLANITGPALIRKICIKMSGANDDELAGLRLRAFYDNNSIPAIDISVANFFGAGKGRPLYKSLPIGTDSSDGFYCFWPMPFRKSFLLQLSNFTNSNISFDSALVQYEPNADRKKMCYFHATENTSTQAGQIYHSILNAQGPGHYVGNFLYLEQQNYSFNMLEGDEQITVNGNDTLYGTGTEDAYNGGYYYNWTMIQPNEPEGAAPQSAIRPLSGILYANRRTDLNYARADQYRWQIADCVPFTKSIDVKIENNYAVMGTKYTSVAFWYKYEFLNSDFNKDCDVDFYDYAIFASQWLNNCAGPDWCSGCDFDKSGVVDNNDISEFVNNWL